MVSLAEIDAEIARRGQAAQPQGLTIADIDAEIARRQQPQVAPQPEVQQTPFLEKAKKTLETVGQLGIPEGGTGLIPSSIEVAQNIPVGLGKAFVGGVQTGSDILGALGIEGAKEFSRRLGEVTAQELKQERTVPETVGQAIGQAIPFAGLGAGLGLVKGSAVASGAAAAAQPLEDSGIRERVKEGVVGAGLGAAGGAAFKGVGVAAKGVGKLAKSIIKPSPVRSAEDILAARLPAEQTRSLLSELKSAPDDSIILLPDIAGDSIKGLTRAIGKIDPARDIVDDALSKRSKGALKRVSDLLRRDVSSVDTYFGNLDNISKVRSDLAQPLYKKAFIEGAEINRENLNKLLLDKRIVDAIEKSKVDFGVRLEAPSNSLEVLDGAKKVIDDVIGKAIREGKNNKAASFLKLKNQLVGELDKASPSYKQARDIFSDFSSVQKSQEQGLNFNTLQPEQLSKLFKTLSVAEKDAFRVGVVEKLRRIAEETGRTASPATRVLKNQNVEDRLKIIMGTKFSAFRKRMQEEIDANETYFKVLGGSRTDINLASQDQLVDGAVRAGSALSTGGKSELLRALAITLRNKAEGINDNTAKAVANILVNRGASINALENIVARQSGAQKRIVGELVDSLKQLPAVSIVNLTKEGK
jgi:hypothetical protein